MISKTIGFRGFLYFQTQRHFRSWLTQANSGPRRIIGRKSGLLSLLVPQQQADVAVVVLYDVALVAWLEGVAWDMEVVALPQLGFHS